MRATASWTNTEIAHFEAADLIRTDYLLTDVLQNLEHIAQVHMHRPTISNDGRPLVLNEPEEMFFRLGAA